MVKMDKTEGEKVEKVLKQGAKLTACEWEIPPFVSRL